MTTWYLRIFVGGWYLAGQNFGSLSSRGFHAVLYLTNSCMEICPKTLRFLNCSFPQTKKTHFFFVLIHFH